MPKTLEQIQTENKAYNNLPIETRMICSPVIRDTQYRTLVAARAIMVKHHKEALAEIADWLANLEKDGREGRAGKPNPTLSDGV
jgi:hypothetical protein